MTKVRVSKTGEVMYLIGVMPRMGVKGECGGKAVAMCAADPRKHGATDGQRYAVVQYPMKSLEIVEEFGWGDAGDRAENQVIDSSGKKGNIPTGKKMATEESTSTTATTTKPSEQRSRAMARIKKERRRFEASQEFAATKVCCRMVKVASKKTDGNAPKKHT